MATYSKKMMGKEVGDAAVYAPSHTMDGKKFGVESAASTTGVKVDPNTRATKDVTPKDVAMRVSAGNPARDDVKTTGIKQRGSGAATKGFTSRGPMG